MQTQSLTTEDDVAAYLSQFHQKLNVFDLFIRQVRGKNLETMFELSISVANIRLVLESLKIENYSQGPLIDQLYQGPDMWVFGKKVRGHEIYIKVSIGMPNSNVLCISFHKAEQPISYPFANQQ